MEFILNRFLFIMLQISSNRGTYIGIYLSSFEKAESQLERTWNNNKQNDNIIINFFKITVFYDCVHVATQGQLFKNFINTQRSWSWFYYYFYLNYINNLLYIFYCVLSLVLY